MISNTMKPFMKGGSAIRAMFEEGKRMAEERGAENVYDFSIGNPAPHPPQEVFDAIDYINHELDPHYVHGYPSNAGFLSTRIAVADDLNARFGDSFMPEHIIMTAGAGAAINAIMKCIFDPGDEMIVFAPFFVEYTNWTRTFGTNTIVVPPNEKGGFQPDVEAMKGFITEKTKAVLINNPNNPTGVIYTKESIQALADALREAEERVGHPIYIISDEPYRELVYDDTEVPYVPAFYDNTLIAYSWSKSLSMPGDRIGYVAVSPRSHEVAEMIDALIIANRVCGVTNGPTIQELIVERCINARVDLDYYRNNRDDLYRIVTESGFTTIKPQGAFYLWIKSPVEDETEVVEAAKKEGILIVPGRSFASPGWLRASFCISNDTIKRSEAAFKKLGEKYFG